MTMSHLDVLGDTVQRYAAEHDLTIATQPLVVAGEPLIAEAMPPESVPIAEIAEFGAVANGQPADRLGAMVLQLQATKPSRGGGFQPQAFLEQDGMLYYPIINVNVLANNPNWWVRHELRHPFQEAKGKQPYERPVLNWGVRAAGAVSLAGAALTAEYQPTLAAVAHLLWAGASIKPLVDPQLITHMLTPAEMDAQRFSYRHRKFTPLPRLGTLEVPEQL